MQLTLTELQFAPLVVSESGATARDFYIGGKHAATGLMCRSDLQSNRHLASQASWRHQKDWVPFVFSRSGTRRRKLTIPQLAWGV